MMSTKQQKFSQVMSHIDKLDTIIIHQTRRTKETKSGSLTLVFENFNRFMLVISYTVIRSTKEDIDIINVSYVEDETKEDQSIAQEKGDILINFKDEHNGLLLDVKLSELSCGRCISKIESPNGVILGYVKKGRFSGYEICNANHNTIFNFNLESRNNEYKAEITNAKTGDITAILTQFEVESDMLSYKLNYITESTILQKVLILSASISELLQRNEKDCDHIFFLLPKYTFVVILYFIIGLFSIVLYIALFVDVLILFVLGILSFPDKKSKKEKDCWSNWFECIYITFYTPFQIYKTLNNFFGVKLCQ